MRDGTARLLSSLHAVVYRLTRGHIGRRLVDNDVLLLTTRGRRSGRPHTVPLLYLREPTGLLVVASWGGRDRHPDWYLNLEADPRVEVQVSSECFPASAEILDEGHHRAAWPRVAAAYEGYAAYQARTTRRIPLVLLRPGAAPPPSR